MAKKSTENSFRTLEHTLEEEVSDKVYHCFASDIQLTYLRIVKQDQESRYYEIHNLSFEPQNPVVLNGLFYDSVYTRPERMQQRIDELIKTDVEITISKKPLNDIGFKRYAYSIFHKPYTKTRTKSSKK